MYLDGKCKLFYYNSSIQTVNNPIALKNVPFIIATIPGNFELDFSKNGLLPTDLFFGKNILSVQQYELYDFWYELNFDVSNTKKLFIDFLGVDTIAEYFINNITIGESSNMLIPHSFDISDFVNIGNNTLHIHIFSTVVAAAKKDYSQFLYALPTNYESLFIRKPAHCFGWDIMPRAVSAGIFKSIEVYNKPDVTINDIHCFTKNIDYKNNTALVSFNIDINLPAQYFNNCYIEIFGKCGNSNFSLTKDITFKFLRCDINVTENLKLWNVVEYGDPNLYEIEFIVKSAITNEVLTAVTKKFGIRKIDVLYSDIAGQENNGHFLVQVNNTKIMIKGTNWICADVFHSKDKEKLPQILPLVKDINCNMLRMWGGNLYEDEYLYNWCDENGILVWQDFAFACGIYPSDNTFLSELEKEIKTIILRLRSHACLMAYCGDNECDFMYSSQEINPKNNLLTRNFIPSLVKKYDPFRCFLPSSPFISEQSYKKNNLASLPENHLWGSRDNFKGAFYANNQSHFISEIGYHACANASSIKKFISKDNLWDYKNDEWLLHSTVPDCKENGLFSYRVQLMVDQVREYFKIVPDNLEDFALCSQISQAEANKFFVEMVRINKWNKSGIALWNLYDGWPQMSDAIVDYYFTKKLSYYYTKRSQSPLCPIMSEPTGWYCNVIICNDTINNYDGVITLLDGETNQVIESKIFYSQANENKQELSVKVSTSSQKLFIMKLETKNKTVYNHYILGNPPFELNLYKKWLKIIATADNLFNCEEIAK